MKKNKKLIFLAILTALSAILGLFESIIPLPIALPGAKLGLSNIVVLTTIVHIGYKEGFVVSVLKCFLLLLLSGSVSSLFFSLAGGVLSSFAMIFSHKYLRRFLSLIGISELGSLFHNLGQVLVAAFILNSKAIFSYLPALILLGIFTGFFVGISANYIVKNLEMTRVLK